MLVTLPRALLFLASSIAARAVTPISSRTPDPNKQYIFAEIPPSHRLENWYPCFTNFTCAVLDVPLDYTNRKLGRASVPIIRYAATTTPYKGMVLTNPGGPGGSGVQFLIESVDIANSVVGTNYDWVSWEPRGVGYSSPAANCTIPANLQRRRLYPLSGPELASVYFEALYNQSFEVGIACEESIGAQNQAGPHVTTATVVRDMISIVDAHAGSKRGKTADNASLLNYWGFSYGTFLGQTFASMYPHRIGRVVLDGVLNAIDWAAGTGDNLVTASDDVVSLFFVYCNAAGPGKCPFYTGTTAHDIYLRFEALVSRLNATYAFEQGWSNATAIEVLLTTLKAQLFEAIYQPINGYPFIAEGLVAVESIIGNVTLATLEELAQELGLVINQPVEPSAFWERAILCSDTGGTAYNRTLDQILTLVPEREKESWVGGEFVFQDIIACAGWPITSKYRYAGPFTGKTNNPLLFVSNTYDIITPHQNGVNSTTRYPGSQLLTIEGTGHTTFGPLNRCGFEKINTFFQTGALPGRDNYCPLEVGAWNITLPGPLSGLSDKRAIKEGLSTLKQLL